eukprot:gene12317-8809_t
MRIYFNATTTSEHEPTVERVIQTLKGTCRSILHSVRYKLPAILVVYVIYYSTTCVNMFPKTGAVGNVSLRQMGLGRKVNLLTEGRIPVHNHDTDNRPLPRWNPQEPTKEDTAFSDSPVGNT